MPHPRRSPLSPPAAGVVALVLLGTGCATRQVPPEPVSEMPPPRFRVPPGCDHPVQGLFAHEEHRSWQYVAQDDGVELQLEVRPGTEARAHALPEGGTGAAPLRIVLQRSPDGFQGFSLARLGGSEATGCTLEFPTRLVACEEHVLTLEALDELAVDARSCEVATIAEDAPWRTHRLIRLPPPDVVPEDAPPVAPE